ncbi:MAG: long-chain fatty acid--CoA ligase [Planctomycetales bacterium]|nr:long-chain fatty acid--CoA ligase [Planctomycetales bacterium]
MCEYAPNLPTLFLDRITQDPDRVCVRFRRSGVIEQRSWDDFAQDVFRAAAGLHRAGVQPGDRVAQLAENRYEWIVADLAILSCQAVHVPIHSPLAPAQVAYQVTHSGAMTVLVSGSEQQTKLRSIADQLPAELQLITYESPLAELTTHRTHYWPEWLACQDPASGRALAESARQQQSPDALATILYTSGTTGQPKGVMLSQRNLVTNATATVNHFQMQADEVRLCFLPLSHIFARCCDLYTWIVLGYQLDLATTRDSVLDDLQWSHPTVLSGVPYFFDRIYRVLRDHGKADEPGALQALLGGNIRYLCSGGAALPDHTYDYFHNQGVPVLQGYGLTETSPVISLSSKACCRRGACGTCLADVEVDTAADGELITRGPHVMLGYWQDPLSTAAVLRDGWFHTGDLGHVDADGFIFITGRKKELIVTAAGKNVAPVMLESLLTADPVIDQALVIGDGRNYLTALLVPSWNAVREQLADLPADAPIAGLCVRSDVRLLFERVVRDRLACVSYHEQVRKFTLLERPFSLERQEITPKLSLRRPVIAEHFQREIELMYQTEAESAARTNFPTDD